MIIDNKYFCDKNKIKILRNRYGNIKKKIYIIFVMIIAHKIIT